MALDHEETFADVWWLVLHEVDMFVEGEFTANNGGMTKQQALRADIWLIRWLPLFDKYKSSERYNEAKFSYSGQVEWRSQWRMKDTYAQANAWTVRDYTVILRM